MTLPTKRQLVPFGKYLLLDRVNIGGMAEVWRGKAFNPGGQDRIVAVKRILPNIAEDEEFIAMFMDEARISVQLAHSGIAQILDFDFERTHNSYYLVMEYIPGKDLRAIYDRCRKLGHHPSVALVAWVLSRTCDALDYAHRKRDASGREMNIIHRDVSPQNVLISYAGDVKMIDFGIAKAAGKATRTQAGILKGKFAYMSPEQIRGVDLDHRSDIFSLGVCLFELLTGQRLFVGESDYSVLEKVRKAEVPLPSKLNAEVPAELERIVLKALARERDQRYSYASEMSEDLQRFLATFDPSFGRKDVVQFMKATFPEDVEKERQRELEYAEIHGPIPPAALAPPRRPSRDGLRAIQPATSPSLGGTPSAPSVLAPGLAPIPALKPRTTSGANNLRAIAPSPPAAVQPPPAEEDCKTVMQEDSGNLLREVREKLAREAQGAASEAPFSDATSELAPPSSGWDKVDTSGGDVALPPEPATREERASVTNTTSTFSGAAPVRGAALGDTQRDFTRDTGESPSAVTRAELEDPPTVSFRAPRPASVPPRPIPSPAGQLVVSVRTVRIVAAAALAAFVLSVGLVATSGLRKSSYVYVDVPEDLRDAALVQINSENFGHPKQWPVEYPTRKGPAVVVVTAEGYRPFREDVDVKGSVKVVQAQLVPVQEFTKLVVITDPPGAEIDLDGKVVRRAGERGIYVGDLALGDKKLLEVRAPGHHLFSKAVGGSSAQVPVTVEARLEAADYPVRITSTPRGAQVFANGRLVGTTPLTFRSSGGSVTLKHHCYTEAQAALPPPTASGDPAQVPVDLRRLPGCH